MTSLDIITTSMEKVFGYVCKSIVQIFQEPNVPLYKKIIITIKVIDVNDGNKVVNTYSLNGVCPIKNDDEKKDAIDRLTTELLANILKSIQK